MIAIAGGTGTLGTRLVPHLIGQGYAVRVLTRDIVRAGHLASNGIEVVQSDVRDPASLDHALRGVGTVISAVSGFAGPRTSPASVDQAGNANLIGAAGRASATFILMSVVGASPSHPIGLFRAKHAAEVTLRGSGIPWTIVRATAFMETWATVMGRTLQATGKIIVFGRGDNPVNFVSVTDVAALVVRAASDSAVHGQAINIGGPENLTLNQVAGLVHEFTGRRAAVWHIPRPALRLLASLAVVRPVLARQARAALVMDTIDMSFDPAPARLAFPDVPETDMATALQELLA